MIFPIFILSLGGRWLGWVLGIQLAESGHLLLVGVVRVAQILVQALVPHDHIIEFYPRYDHGIHFLERFKLRVHEPEHVESVTFDLLNGVSVESQALHGSNRTQFSNFLDVGDKVSMELQRFQTWEFENFIVYLS